ncbi:MAG: protein kinase domain-containing protein [Actinomycetota bacterium]
MAATRILNDRYEMGSPLGKGGMAHVYLGTDRVLDRTVAIKVLSGKYAGDDSFVTRFRREAQAAAGLNHANIVGVYDTGDEGQMHYIVMEYVEGETLGDVLRRDGRLDPERAAAVAAEVATALHTAHEKGLVHRDVKPGNVMIDREGQVKVVDFGIARAAADDTLTQTGLVLGTASYLSPEQAQGLPVDARSDIYSLGCVLYEMLMGRPPFDGDTPVAIAYMHVNETPVRPTELEPSIPPHLDEAVMRALQKDPQARFPTAEAFRAAVAGGGPGTATIPIAAAGGDTDVLPPTAPEGLPGRRGWSWFPVALIAAAILAVAGILALTLGGPDERAGQRQEQPPAEEPTTPAAASVEQALGVLNGVLTEAVNAEEMTFDAAGKVAERADAALEAWQAGDADKALDELSKAREEVDEAFEDGEIASEVTAGAIHEAISAVESAVTASAPAEETPTVDEEEGEEGDEGPGNSENAPGQQKKDDKGKGKGAD